MGMNVSMMKKKHQTNQQCQKIFRKRSINCWLVGYGCYCIFQQYFSYIVAQVLLEEQTGVPSLNHMSQTGDDTDCIGKCKSTYNTIMTMMPSPIFILQYCSSSVLIGCLSRTSTKIVFKSFMTITWHKAKQILSRSLGLFVMFCVSEKF